MLNPTVKAADASRYSQSVNPADTPRVETAPTLIRRDLHDGLIQVLYGVSLDLEGAAEDVAADPDTARTRIETAIDRLAGVMRDVRQVIMDHDADPPPLESPATMLNRDTSPRAFRAAGVHEPEEHHV